MGALGALLKSLNFRNIKPAAYAWMFNFFLSLLIYTGVYNFLDLTTAGSPLSSTAPPHPDLVYLLLELGQIHAIGMRQLLGWVVLVIGLYILISVLVSGGIYASLIDGGKIKFKDLFARSIEYFPKMLKVFLLILIVWAVAAALILVPLYFIWKITGGIGNTSLIEAVLYLWVMIAFPVGILSIATYDFCRIISLKTERNVLYCLGKSVRIVFGNKVRVLLIFSIFIFMFLASHLVFTFILSQVDAILPWLVLLGIHQFFIFTKYYFKVMVMNSEVLILESLPAMPPPSEKSNPK